MSGNGESELHPNDELKHLHIYAYIFLMSRSRKIGSQIRMVNPATAPMAPVHLTRREGSRFRSSMRMSFTSGWLFRDNDRMSSTRSFSLADRIKERIAESCFEVSVPSSSPASTTPPPPLPPPPKLRRRCKGAGLFGPMLCP